MVLVGVCFAKALPPTRLCARAPSAVRSFELTPLAPWSKNSGGRRVEARGTVFVVRTVASTAMFGLKPIWRGKVKVNVSDPTRTILDLLDTPALGGGITSVLDMLKSYFSSAYRDPKLLIQYADQLGNKAVLKRLGFLAATYLPNEAELVAECRKRLSAGNAKLDPKLPADRLVTAWRLLVPAGFPKAPKT